MRPSTLFSALFSVAVGLVANAHPHQDDCKLLPEDKAWPSSHEWSKFNSSISGHLVKTVPIGAPCYDGDEAACQDVKDRWRMPELHEESSSSVMHPIWTNHSCSPFNDIEAGDVCEIGSYVQYAVDVHTKEDVVAALKFVKKHNIRFVVRNTGHDFIGRSTGKGALAIWMHHLRDITWPTDDTVKVQAGVLGHEILEASHEQDRLVVVGNCPTVGYAGGFTGGGGHGILSGEFGLSADNTLEFEVITTEGKFLTASPTKNAELYRALSGGGAGTYAIVWSVTMQTHPDLPVAFGKIDFPGLSTDLMTEVFRTQISLSPSFTEKGIYFNYLFFPPSLSVPLIVWYNHTQDELNETLEPYFTALANVTTDYEYTSSNYDSFLDMYRGQGANTQEVETAARLWGGRLLPSRLFPSLADETQNSTTDGELVDLIDYYIKGSDSFWVNFIQLPEYVKSDGSAVIDAWRDMHGFLVPLLALENNDTEAIYTEKREFLTAELNDPLASLTDGVYTNEADPDDPSWPEAYYGSTEQYNRLLAVKDKYDPAGILHGRNNVGSDRWAEDSNGRLCRV